MKPKILLLFSLLFLSNLLFAQEKRDYEQIRFLLENKYYGKVLPILETWVREDSTQYLAAFYLAVGYVETQKPEKALVILKKLHKKQQDRFVDFDFWYGKTLYLLEQFNSSLFFLNRYLEQTGGNKRKEGEKLLEYCQNAIQIVSNVRSEYSLEPLSGEVNTELAEFGALASGQNRKIVFNRQAGSNIEQILEKNQYKNDILFSQENAQRQWETPQLWANQFGTQTQVLQWIERDKQILLLEDKKLKISQLVNGKWTNPALIHEKLVGVSSAYYFWDSQKGEDRIIFSARPPLEQMDFDLFEIQKKDGKWSAPQAIPELNTKYNEINPFWDSNAQKLYFSSEGHQNIGGFDIFSTSYDMVAGKWRTPENMGFPINSVYDDLTFVHEGDFGYLSSNRLGGAGLEDIYRFWTFARLPLQGRVFNRSDQKPIAGCRLLFEVRDFTLETLTDAEGRYEVFVPVNNSLKISVFSHNRVLYEENWTLQVNLKRPKVSIRNYYIHHFTPQVTAVPKTEFWVRGKIRDAYSNRPLVAPVKLYPADKSKASTQASSTENGFFSLKIEKNAGKCWLECTPKGYFYERIQFDTQGLEDSIHWDVQLKKIASKAVLILKNVYFESGSAKLQESSFAELDQLALFLEQNKEISIEIAGHTDNVGAATANRILSEKRAQAVQEYLQKKGIPAKRLQAVGYGDTQPLASNDDEKDGRELNRRIEIRIR